MSDISIQISLVSHIFNLIYTLFLSALCWTLKILCRRVQINELLIELELVPDEISHASPARSPAAMLRLFIFFIHSLQAKVNAMT
jgi:hypothetical protein